MPKLKRGSGRIHDVNTPASQNSKVASHHESEAGLIKVEFRVIMVGIRALDFSYLGFSSPVSVMEQV